MRVQGFFVFVYDIEVYNGILKCHTKCHILFFRR